MSSTAKYILGGSDSKSGNSSQSGFSLLPPELQKAFKDYATNVTGQMGNNATASDLFKLPTLNPGATNAISQLSNQDFTVNPENLNKNIGMQLNNPYQQNVINQIEKAQNGNLSQLNTMLTNAGTFGSNRGVVGASDIANTAADQIGSYMSGQYNNALQNAMTTIPGQQMASANAATGAGQLEQQQKYQNQQSPIASLMAYGQMLGAIPQSGGSQSQGASSATSSTGYLPSVAQAISSDIRLKKDIEFFGEENGHKTYKFKYITDESNQEYIGVMAQDLLEDFPDAVLKSDDGFYAVDYNKIGVNFRRSEA